MNYLISILLVVFSSIDPTEIARINALKIEAEKAYLAGDFDKSITKYSYLIDSMNVDDEFATMNLAHSYYKLKNNDEAISKYQSLQDSKNESLKSLAYQQLGILSNDPKTLEKALSYFKESIKSDPSNDDARYNYELLKKKLKEQKENQDPNQDDKNQDQEEKDDKEEKEEKDKKENQNKENKDGEDQEKKEKDEEEKDGEEKEDKQNKEGEKSEEENKKEQQEQKDQDKSDEEKEQNGEQKENEENDNKKNENNEKQPPSTSEKLKQMNISEEKAKMILEALRNNEIQYIQQNRRKATKKKDNSKPDW